MSATVLAQCLIVLACALTLWRMTRELPLQNVLACVALISALSSLIEIINAKTGVPFGSTIFTDKLGYRLFQLLPWPVPLLWIIILLNARSLSRFFLCRQRQKPYYGLWVIALAAVIATVFDAALEAIAAANQWWIWATPSLFGAPWTNAIGWFASTVFIFVAITPWLLDKKAAGRVSSR